MKKFVIKSIGYFALTFLFANGSAYVFLRILGNSDFFKTTYLVHHFPENQHFDLTVFGSSRSLAALDAKMIGGDIEGLAVNFSMDNTALPSSLLMLQLFYNQGYTSDYVVLSVDIPDFEDSKMGISENDHRFLPFINDPEVEQYFKVREEGLLKPAYTSRLLPVFGFAYFNMELLAPAVQALVNPAYKYRFDELGNYQYPDHLGQSEMPPPRYLETSLGNTLLQDFQKLTAAHNSLLIIYIAPYLQDDVRISKNIPYWVINHSRLINDPKYFSDYIHVVNSGKKIASEAFGRDFLEGQKN